MKIKSIILVVALAMGGISLSSAQSLKLLYNGEDVSNSEVSVGGTASDNDVKVILNITNTTESAIDVKVRKNVRADIEGSYNTFCFGSCFPPQTEESTNPYTIGAGETTGDDVFYVQLYPDGNTGTAQIAYEVFNVDDTDDNVAVLVNFSITPTGITLSKKDVNLKVYPNPVAGELVYVDYSLPNGALNATFTMYNMLGTRVYGRALEDKSGKIEISTNSFSKGIYLYSIEVD